MQRNATQKTRKKRKKQEAVNDDARDAHGAGARPIYDMGT